MVETLASWRSGRIKAPFTVVKLRPEITRVRCGLTSSNRCKRCKSVPGFERGWTCHDGRARPMRSSASRARGGPAGARQEGAGRPSDTRGFRAELLCPWAARPSPADVDLNRGASCKHLSGGHPGMSARPKTQTPHAQASLRSSGRTPAQRRRTRHRPPRGLPPHRRKVRRDRTQRPRRNYKLSNSDSLGQITASTEGIKYRNTSGTTR